MTQPMTPEFDQMDFLKKSWELFTKNAAVFLGATFLFALIMVVAGQLFIAQFFLIGPLSLGFYRVAAAAVRSQPVEFSDFFSGFKRFVPACLAGLIIALFSGIGFVLCIIPGLLIGILYMPAYLFIADGEDNFWNAMESSRTMVMNNFVQWLLVFLVLLVINFVGAIPCGLGLLVTGPLSAMVVVMAYDQERGGQQAPLAEAVPPPAPDAPAAP